MLNSNFHEYYSLKSRVCKVINLLVEQISSEECAVSALAQVYSVDVTFLFFEVKVCLKLLVNQFLTNFSVMLIKVLKALILI